jgi:hypothetical protein
VQAVRNAAQRRTGMIILLPECAGVATLPADVFSFKSLFDEFYPALMARAKTDISRA